MMQHDNVKSYNQADISYSHLIRALRVCTCSVAVEEGQQYLTDGINNINSDVTVLLCRSSYELQSHTLSMIYRQTQNPVILYLSNYNEVSELVGLRTGAFDVLNAEMSVNVIAERIMAVHRRDVINGVGPMKIPEERSKVPTDGFWSDIKNNIFWIDDRMIEFTRTEIKLLEALRARAGEIVTREELIAVLQKYTGNTLHLRSIDSHIKRIRRKFSDTDKRLSLIKSAYGAGYTFVPCDRPLWD